MRSNFVKLTATYRRELKTRRRYVFENIMDLEHVCVLRHRWFRNLRVRTCRPDYVEYRLTSLFHGLRQEVLARGGPVDENRYWYEFLGRLARIRVDGRMEGPDGNLTQTETITYEFPWYVAPFMFLLRPFFKKQKANILSDDAALLERVYALEGSGFRRLEPKAPRVVVYGGTGFFGRLVVDDLLRSTNAEIVVASRNPSWRDPAWSSARVTLYESDLSDYGSILSTLEGAAVAIGCAGPFQGMAPNLLRVCIEKRVHYIDMADDREFIERCGNSQRAAEQAGIMVFTGCSVVPGMSSLLTGYCAQRVGGAERVRIFITPGTRHPRGPASFLCLLATVGEPIPVVRDGRQQAVRGWSGREDVDFPPPLGRRSAYLIVDIPDYELLPRYFQARTVEFRIGSEFHFLNRGLEAVRWLKQSSGFSNLNWFLPAARLLIRLAAPFGTSQGAVMVEVTHAGRKLSMSAYREEWGEIIPAVLPSIAAGMVLNQEISTPGIVPLHTWLPLDRLAAELGHRGIRLAIQSGDAGDWTSLGAEMAAA